MILNNSDIKNDDWVLILEDDILINNYDEDIINNLCKEADKLNSKYINLYVCTYDVITYICRTVLNHENSYPQIKYPGSCQPWLAGYLSYL
jgi:GR25 family glycosyltransferase involved in LPS biosynthesis